jgi:hypothetical protein
MRKYPLSSSYTEHDDMYYLYIVNLGESFLGHTVVNFIALYMSKSAMS